jgi:hypothetical protein
MQFRGHYVWTREGRAGRAAEAECQQQQHNDTSIEDLGAVVPFSVQYY